jgi:hypothetical protein
MWRIWRWRKKRRRRRRWWWGISASWASHCRTSFWQTGPRCGEGVVDQLCLGRLGSTPHHLHPSNCRYPTRTAALRIDWLWKESSLGRFTAVVHNWKSGRLDSAFGQSKGQDDSVHCFPPREGLSIPLPPVSSRPHAPTVAFGEVREKKFIRLRVSPPPHRNGSSMFRPSHITSPPHLIALDPSSCVGRRTTAGCPVDLV